METEPILPYYHHFDPLNSFSGHFSSNHNQTDAEMEVEEMQLETVREPSSHVFPNVPNNGSFTTNVNQHSFSTQISTLQQQPQTVSTSSSLPNVQMTFSNSTLHCQNNLQSIQPSQQMDTVNRSKGIPLTHSNLSSQTVSQKIPVNENEEIEEEFYEEDCEEEDEDDDFDDLDDVDEQMVQQMLLSATPENQQAIRLLLSGYSACASETIRYLVEEEQMSPNSPMLLALVQHLKMQETLLIISCLRTQHMLAQQQQANALLTSQPNLHSTATVASTNSNNSKKDASKTNVTSSNHSLNDTTTVSGFNLINRPQFQNTDFNDSGFEEQ